MKQSEIKKAVNFLFRNPTRYFFPDEIIRKARLNLSAMTLGRKFRAVESDMLLKIMVDGKRYYGSGNPMAYEQRYGHLPK